MPYQAAIRLSARALPFFALLLCSLGVMLLGPGLSLAASVSTTASEFTGSPLDVSVVIDDESQAGDLVITLEIGGEGAIGDLRGFFAQISDETLLPGLTVSGTDVTDSLFAANGVINLGGGSNLNGGGTPCPCDLGVEIGTSGAGANDIQSTTFRISHVSEDLTVEVFRDQLVGVRVTSVGGADGSRGGSSKLAGTVPIPEPGTGLLMGLGLLGLSSAGSRGDSRPRPHSRA